MKTLNRSACSKRSTRNLFAAGLLLLLASTGAAFAGSATWKSSPATGDWNTATNWTPQTVPNGPSDVATFATSSTTAVSVSAATEVNGITFDSGASAYTISVPPNNGAFGLNITGVGVTNNSSITQKIASDQLFGIIRFFNSATAGSSTSYAITNGAQMQFNDASTAGSGTFTLYGQLRTFHPQVLSWCRDVHRQPWRERSL
jgi:hypothetical protein